MFGLIINQSHRNAVAVFDETTNSISIVNSPGFCRDVNERRESNARNKGGDDKLVLKASIWKKQTDWI